MRCIRVGGGDTPLNLSLCRRRNLKGPVSPLDISVARCPGTDGLRVFPHRGTQVSRRGGIRHRKMIRGVGEVSWRVAEKRRTCCGRGRVFHPSSSCPSFARINGEGTPIVLWGIGDGRCCRPVLICTLSR